MWFYIMPRSLIIAGTILRDGYTLIQKTRATWKQVAFSYLSGIIGIDTGMISSSPTWGAEKDSNVVYSWGNVDKDAICFN
jgi:hypothetical protein